MDARNDPRGWRAACRKRWFSVRLPRSTSPLFIKAVLSLFLLGSALQFFR
jgi:hypothetical protein